MQMEETDQVQSDQEETNREETAQVQGTVLVVSGTDSFLANSLVTKLETEGIAAVFSHGDIKEIEKTIPVFERMNKIDNVCVIGNKEAIEACGDQLDEIFDLNRKTE